MIRLVFATHNANKLSEARSILGSEYVLDGLSDIGFHDEIPEPWPDMKGNALEKARAVFQATALDCFADDSGLEVEALNGAPGVFSARYAGPGKNSRDNMQKLLSELQGMENRRARFRAVVALVFKGQEYIFQGTINGHIALFEKGIGGFGYDPVFIPEGYRESFAEMNPRLKNSLSHRNRALLAMKTCIESLLRSEQPYAPNAD